MLRTGSYRDLPSRYLPNRDSDQQVEGEEEEGDDEEQQQSIPPQLIPPQRIPQQHIPQHYRNQPLPEQQSVRESEEAPRQQPPELQPLPQGQEPIISAITSLDSISCTANSHPISNGNKRQNSNNDNRTNSSNNNNNNNNKRNNTSSLPPSINYQNGVTPEQWKIFNQCGYAIHNNILNAEEIKLLREAVLLDFQAIGVDPTNPATYSQRMKYHGLYVYHHSNQSSIHSSSIHQLIYLISSFTSSSNIIIIIIIHFGIYYLYTLGIIAVDGIRDVGAEQSIYIHYNILLFIVLLLVILPALIHIIPHHSRCKLKFMKPSVV